MIILVLPFPPLATIPGPSLGLISGRHSAPFPTPNSIFFSQIDSSKFPTEHSQICWPKLVQSNDIYSSNSVLLSFINVQMALFNAVFKGVLSLKRFVDANCLSTQDSASFKASQQRRLLLTSKSKVGQLVIKRSVARVGQTVWLY